MIPLMRTKAMNMQSLIDFLPNNLNMIEIGVFAGESSYAFLESGKILTYTAVDNWVQNYDPRPAGLVKPKANDWNFPDMNEVERSFDNKVSKFKNVKKLKMSSFEASKLVADNSVDFIYIDADHAYESIKSDISLWKPKLRQGGLLGGHDYQNGPYNVGVERAVNEFFKTVTRFPDSSWIVKI